ncbi:MAG TPA: hypothetical protein VM890_16055 [Longimicrobium sp.]|jgi:hypothetical protein|nr:hypothetical protein [Longimicrobium sp.]
MRIELTPDLESALVDAARRQGTTPDLLAEAYLRERLDTRLHESAGTEPKTLADFLSGYVGVLGHEGAGEPSNLSEDTGRRFAEALSRSRAEGRL